MKLFISLFTLLLFSDLVFAHGDDHKMGHESIEQKKTQTLSGQLIGLTCFVKHQSKGDSHKDCFRECAEKGLPIGILTADKKIYQISGVGHADLKTTNKQFIKYAEQDVVVKGEVFESNNMNMVVVKGIKLAK